MREASWKWGRLVEGLDGVPGPLLMKAWRTVDLEDECAVVFVPIGKIHHDGDGEIVTVDGTHGALVIMDDGDVLFIDPPEDAVHQRQGVVILLGRTLIGAERTDVVPTPNAVKVPLTVTKLQEAA